MAEKGQRPDWRAYTTYESVAGTKWIEIGVAFQSSREDIINIVLNALPVNGKIVLKKPKYENQL